MSTDLVTQDQILDIRTGELVPTTDTAKVADILRHLRDYRQQLMEGVKACEAVLIEEARRQGTKTLHVDGAEATITGGAKLEWDVEVLDELRAAGLPDERYADLVLIEHTYKVNAAVARQIAGANPTYAAIVERAKSYADAPVRVTVK